MDPRHPHKKIQSRDLKYLNFANFHSPSILSTDSKNKQWVTEILTRNIHLAPRMKRTGLWNIYIYISIRCHAHKLVELRPRKPFTDLLSSLFFSLCWVYERMIADHLLLPPDCGEFSSTRNPNLSDFLESVIFEFKDERGPRSTGVLRGRRWDDSQYIICTRSSQVFARKVSFLVGACWIHTDASHSGKRTPQTLTPRTAYHYYHSSTTYFYHIYNR
jgi:hypothetical protein